MNEPRTNVLHDPSADMSQYFRSISDLERINAEDELSLARAWRDRGCRDSRERLITANLRLAIAIAKRYANRGMPMDELVAEANLGLIRAVDSFEPSGGARLSTYAVYWIRSAIAESFARSVPRARLSRADRLDGVALQRAHDAFQVRHGRPPSALELASELTWHPEKVNVVRSRLAGRFRQESITEHAAAFAADRAHAMTDADERETEHKRVHRMLARLSPEERQAIELRFGLDAGEARSLNAIAQITGLPRKVARKRLITAMNKLSRAGRGEQASSLSTDTHPQHSEIAADQWRSVA